MAQVYLAEGLAQRRARFEYSFRSNPDYGRHQAGYCITAGLHPFLDWMEGALITAGDLDVLRSQTDAGERRFGDEFLAWLEADGGFGGLEIQAIPEGRVVHPGAPIIVVEGPLAAAQLVETALLNHLNYSTLIATKASRVSEAGRGRPVLEFGMRRGPASGVEAGGRAALIGGADFTSNVSLSAVMGLDPKGTHAHSLVQVFMALGGGELEAFRSFAAVYPDACTLVVDTIDTLDSGVPNAITVFHELRSAGHEPQGIRLDSGDLAYLAIRSAAMLNEAGFQDVPIVLSSNLDELAIWQILSQIDQEAPRYGVDPARLVTRLSYGVGTRMITSHGAGALDGVYKLVAIEGDNGLQPALKLSDSMAKIALAGDKSLWRVYDDRNTATADVIGLAGATIDTTKALGLHHPIRPEVSRVIAAGGISDVEPLLADVYGNGSRLVNEPTLEEMRNRRKADLDLLDPGVRRLVNPHLYHVSVTDAVRRRQDQLLADAREGKFSG